jgi:hypothetical protein
MTDFKLSQLNAAIDATHSPELYSASLTKIRQEHDRNLVKYTSEGATFLILILIGAASCFALFEGNFCSSNISKIS